jgi:tetratricopeptide (TPR) repeat protein
MLCAAVALWALAAIVCAAPLSRGETWRLLNERNFAALEASLGESQQRYERDFATDQEAERALSRAFRVFYFADESTSPIYDAWVKAYPGSYAASLARGEYLTALAWKRRGSEFARKISPEQWSQMREVVASAIAELARSLDLAEKPVLSYELLIELAMMDGLPGSDDLLASARSLDRTAYYPSRAYLAALRPQWGGSIEAMEAFVADYRKLKPAPWKANCLEALVADIRALPTAKPDAQAELRWLDRAIELCPRADRYQSRGHHHQKQRRPDLAEKDYREALRLDSGSTWARATLGMLLVSRGDGEEGVALCREAAREDEPNALQCLAYAYKTGRGVPADPAQVVHWLERAASAGQTAAMNDLAGYYWRGDVVPQNRNKAIGLWRKAALAGHDGARKRLAELGISP